MHSRHLPSSSHEGIGGIPGTKDFPKGTTKGFQAFKKPDGNTVVPRAAPGKTDAAPSTTTTETASSPAVSTAVTTTTTATTSALSSSSIVGKKPLDPKVTVTWMFPQAMESAHAKLAAKADPNQSGQGKTSSKDSSTEESMDFETTHVSRHMSGSRTRTHRSRSQSSTRDKEEKGAEGKGTSTRTPSQSKESEKRPSHSGSTAVSEMLLKAGSVKLTGKGARPMPKYTPEKEYKVDYSQEPCPPPAFQLDQPSGCHLEKALKQPKSTWHADPNMSQATLHGHLQALAQNGSQHVLFCSQQGMLRMRTEAIRVWDHSNEAFQRLAREPVFIDEGHAGVILGSHHELQRCKDNLKADLKAAHKELETEHQNNRDTLKTSVIQDQRIVSLTAEVQEANAARDRVQAEVEQLKASNRQLLSTTDQDAANAGMVELKRQLDHANQQLARQGNTSSTNALVERCKELEEKLQLGNQRLQETCDAGGLTQMQARVTSMAGEHDADWKRVQELLAEGRTLETQYQELKVQLAATTTEYESRLRVANLELESKQKQYDHETEFAQGQKAEVERLRGKLKKV